MNKSVKILLLCILTVMIFIGGFFVVKNLLEHNSIESEIDNPVDLVDIDDEHLQEFSVLESIICDIEETTSFYYNINGFEDYSLDIEILDKDIATINVSTLVITPIMIGRTKIITTLSCDNYEETKYTDLEIIATYNDCDITIYSEDSKSDFLIKDSEYIIEIVKNYNYKCNGNLDIDFINIFENAELTNNYEISTLSKNYKVIKYRFIPKITGKFIINYLDDYFNENIEIICYNQTNQINFSVQYAQKLTENDYKLFIFNETYKNTANKDGFYNTAILDYSQNKDSYEDLDVKILSNAPLDNKVAFEEDGERILIDVSEVCSFVIEIYSKASNYNITINFCVEKILASHLIFNGEKYSIDNSSTITEELYVGSSTDFEYGLFPCYALGNITTNIDSELSLDNNSVTLHKFGNYNAVIKYDEKNILTIQYIAKRQFYFSIDPSTNIQPYNSCEIINNDVELFEINYNKSNFGNYFKLSFSIAGINDSIYAGSICTELLDMNFNIYDDFIYDYEISSNTLFIIFDKDEPVEFYLRVIEDESIFIKIKINII